MSIPSVSRQSPRSHCVRADDVDFLIDISSIDNRSADNEEASKARVRYLTEAWKNREDNWTTFLPITKEQEALGSTVSLSLVPKASRTPSAIRPDLQRMITGVSQSGGGDDGDAGGKGRESRDERRPGMWKQTRVLIARSHKRVYRNYILMVGLVAQGIILGVMVGVTYYQLPEVCPSDQPSDMWCHAEQGRHLLVFKVSRT